MTCLVPAALLAVFALIAFDGADAASPQESDAVSNSSGDVRFSGVIVVPTASSIGNDAQEAASLPIGRIIRRGSTGFEKGNPLRTVVVQPARGEHVRVVLVSYD